MLEEFTPDDLYSGVRQLVCARIGNSARIENLCPNLGPRLHEEAVNFAVAKRAFDRDAWGDVQIAPACAGLLASEIFARCGLNGPPPGFMD